MVLAGVDLTYAVALSFAFFPLLCWFVLTARPASIMVVIPLFALLYVGFSLFGLGGLPELQTINQTVRSVLFLTGMVLLIQVIAVMNFARNQLLETFRAQANTDFLSGLNNDRAFAAEVKKVLSSLRQPKPGTDAGGQADGHLRAGRLPGAYWQRYFQSDCRRCGQTGADGQAGADLPCL